MERARAILEDPAQGVLDLAVEPSPPVVPLLETRDEIALFATGKPLLLGGRDSRGRVVGTDSRVLFDVLAGVYADLGFDVVADWVFRDLVIARVVEPTSRAGVRGYRDQNAAACFAHPDQRGRHLVGHMLTAFIESKPDLTSVGGFILDSNTASIRAFTNMGWSRTATYCSSWILGRQRSGESRAATT